MNQGKVKDEKKDKAENIISQMRQNLINSIVDGGVLLEETWKCFGKPTLRLPTFHLVGAEQHGTKPLVTLIAQKVIVGIQHFFPNFCFNVHEGFPFLMVSCLEVFRLLVS